MCPLIRSWSCLRNISFSLAKRICAFVEEDTKLKRFAKPKTVKQQKYPILLRRNNIKRALLKPLNELKESKDKRTEEMIPFLFTHNPSSHNIFQIIRQTFQNFYHSKTIRNFFGYKTPIKFLRRAPNLERLIWQSKFMPVEQHFQVTSCGKDFACSLFF